MVAASKVRRRMARPPKPIDISTYQGRLGSQIRTRRGKLELSIDQLSQRLVANGAPINPASLYKYESGEQSMPLDYLPALAIALETTVRQLLPPS